MCVGMYDNVSGLVAAAQNDTFFHKPAEAVYRNSGRIWIDEYRNLHSGRFFIEIIINKNWR